MDQKSEEFYSRLKEELDNTTKKWPSEYLYKFILPNDIEKVKIVETTFDGMGAVIHTKQSKNGNYISVSINVVMRNSEDIIEKYKQLSTIEGIISL